MSLYSVNLDAYLERMWKDYTQMNPQADKIYKLFTDAGEKIVNDHIALRTWNHPKLGLKSLAQHFEKLGYKSSGEYFFKEKKLYAQHWEHSNPDQPKIFISELELQKMSPFVQETLNKCAEQIASEKIQQPEFVFSGRHWNINYSTYLKLAEESEYASWVYAYGFRPNHFTVSINHLKNFKDILKLNEFIKGHKIQLNTSGGEVKGTAAELLEQSSTIANELPIEFTDGVHAVPACYYEFAKRYPMTDGKLYQGFIAKSADKIFESTNRSK